jgi:hypothetical protein
LHTTTNAYSCDLTLTRADAALFAELSRICKKTFMKMLFTEGSLSAVNNKSEFLVESFSASAPSLRIAIVTETFPPEVNGVAMTLGRIVDGLLKRGHVVQLIRPRQAIETPSAAFAGLDEVLSIGLPVPAYGELRFGLPAKRRLTNLWK